MFATYANAANHHGAGRNAVWCKADHLTQSLLLAKAPALYFSPPYVGPSGWVGIRLDGRIDWDEVAERLAEAHELAHGASKARKQPARRRGRRR
jgi:hypothetical protein